MTDADDLIELSDSELDAVCDYIASRLQARIEKELEAIFPDAAIISVELDKSEDSPVAFRMTIRGIHQCPSISPYRVRKVGYVFGGPDMCIDVDYSTPVSNGFVLVASPRIKKTDADEQC